MVYEVVLIDATKSPVERPKKSKDTTTAIKKRHTIKSQVVVNKANGQIIVALLLMVGGMILGCLKRKLRIDSKVRAVVDRDMWVFPGFMLI